MKKSKFDLLSMVLILLLCFSLFSVSVEVKAATDGDLDIDIEEFWVGNGWPLSAMNYYDEDGKGIKFYVDTIMEYEIYNYFIVYPVREYDFVDGIIDIYESYIILLEFCSESLVSVFNYYLDIYEPPSDIPEFDRVLVIWDVDQQMFVSSDYLSYQIETSFNEGYAEGYDVGYAEGYDEGHDVGYSLGYEAGYDEGYNIGYNEGYDIGFEVAVPKMDILLITLIMYVISIIIYFKFNLKWVLVATTLLWFVPIFLVENLFIKIFSVIMIIVTITLTFFGEREEEF